MYDSSNEALVQVPNPKVVDDEIDKILEVPVIVVLFFCHHLFKSPGILFLTKMKKSFVGSNPVNFKGYINYT